MKRCRNCNDKNGPFARVGAGRYMRWTGLYSCKNRTVCRKRQKFLTARCLSLRTQGFREKLDYEHIRYREHDRARQWASLGYPVHVGPGFAFVELLVVIAIIGILASIGIPYGLCAIEKAHFVTYEIDMRRAQADLDDWFAVLGGYPATLQELYPNGGGPQELLYRRGPSSVATQGSSRRPSQDGDMGLSGLPEPNPGGYLLQTTGNLCPGCVQVDLLFVGPGMGPVQRVLISPPGPNPNLDGSGGGDAGPVVCLGPGDPSCPETR